VNKFFSANCAACHAGGNNVIMPEKTLKLDALEANQMNSVEAPFSLTALLQGYSLELGALYGLVRIRTVHARPGPVFTCWEVKSVYLERLNL